MNHTILVRYSTEVGIKRNANSKVFLERVQRRIRSQLKAKGLEFELIPGWGHILLHVDKMNEASAVLLKTFGVGTFSPCVYTCNSTYEDIFNSKEILAPYVENKTFRVTCSKVDVMDLSKSKIERELGSNLFSYSNGVDLKKPEAHIQVEVIRGKAYFFTTKIKAQGGLSFAKKERALVLMSGGFDSAVAAWQMMKRGVMCDYLFLNMAGKSNERMVLQVTKVLNDLWAKNTHARFFAVDFNPMLDEIKEKVENSYRQIILKRMMYKLAYNILKKGGHEVIVTGESIAQVSSQTLRNLSIIDNAVPACVLRPISTMDKPEIMDKARMIGTALLSEKIVEVCGITQGQPVTKANFSKTLEEEAKIDIDVLENCLQSSREFDVDSIEAQDLRRPYLYVDKIESGFEVIDCQEKHMHRAWNYPNSHHIPADMMMKFFKNLDKGKKYILYCTYGSRTPYIAEMMQLSGYEAYSFKGDVRALKKSMTS